MSFHACMYVCECLCRSVCIFYFSVLEFPGMSVCFCICVCLHAFVSVCLHHVCECICEFCVYVCLCACVLCDCIFMCPHVGVCVGVRVCL